MDIAAASMQMSAAQVSTQASMAVMKSAMESVEQISTQLVDQLLNLSVGPQMPSQLDMYI